MKKLSRPLALLLVAAFVSACSGGGGGGGNPIGRAPLPTPTSTATSPGASPTPTPTGVNEAAFQCPTSDTVTQSSSRATSRGMDALTRKVNTAHRNVPGTPGRIEVTYDLATAGSSRAAIGAREAALGAAFVGEYDYAHLGIATRLLRVAPAQVAAVTAKLRMQAGVKSVFAGGNRLTKQAVTTSYFPNDPYFQGFATTVPPTATSTAPPSTFKVGPYEESANVPGQWNMHAIGLDKAFAYSQTGNGSTVAVNPGALGSSAVKIAVIDVGEDTTHPELTSKIVYQKCFITDPSNVQSTSGFTTDEDGHGTDVAGIAGAATNNGLGFTGAGGNVSIYGYRVEATPDDNCTSDTTTDDQCSTDTADIASAINDAVAHNVNVITISLGGGSCTNGTDSDPVEGNAINNAISANIVVVAAAGNDGSQGLEAPACDTGVIAAGATSLADGQPNGLNNSNGSAAAPTEYVASYSDYGSPGAAVHSSTAWGIVAPGGDPNGDTDADDLHWIEDIWTTTPYMSNSSDTNFAGSCVVDYPGTGTTTDCRTLIAGTSMASPTVAGAAALILSANSAYQSPSKMKTLLCATADDIVDAKEGCGRLNVYRAMAVALSDPTPP